MSHVLLVEPDDDFCLFLRQAVTAAGSSLTITDSVAGATAALRAARAVDLVITDARLPDGSGSAVAREATRPGRRTWILRCSNRGAVEVADKHGVLFRGTRTEVCDFLEKAIIRRRRSRNTPPSLSLRGPRNRA
jgi:DNA-binding NtrC family response regulator